MQEVEAGGSGVQGHPWLHSECSQPGPWEMLNLKNPQPGLETVPMVECWPEPGEVRQACHPDTGETEAGGSSGHPQLHSGRPAWATQNNQISNN